MPFLPPSPPWGRTRRSELWPARAAGGRGRPTHPIRRGAHSFGRPRVTPGWRLRTHQAAGWRDWPHGAFGRLVQGAPGRRGRRGRVGAPVRAVAEPGPAPDQQRAGQGDDGRPLAGGAAAGQPGVGRPRPGVVAEQGPGALDQQLLQGRRVAAGDAALAVTLAGRVLPRHPAADGADLLAGGEPLRVAEVGGDRLGRAGADAGDRRQPPGGRVGGGPPVQRRLTGGDLAEQVAVVGQGQVQHPPPQLVGGAVGQRPGLAVEAGQPELGPGAVAARGRPPLGGEQGADAVLGGDAPADQRLAVGAEGPALAGGGVRQHDGRPSAERLQLGQAAGVVAVGLPLKVLERPGLAVGVGHPDGHPLAPGRVVDPAGVGAGLDDDHRAGVAGQQAGHLRARGVDGVEPGRGGDAVVRRRTCSGRGRWPEWGRRSGRRRSGSSWGKLRGV
jgi:hypothetical protein